MVAIKDMEMPKNCYECIVKNHCGVGIADGWRTDRRADDCPLIEIEERKVAKMDRKQAIERFNDYLLKTQQPYMYPKDKRAVTTAILSMEKLEKIEQIINGVKIDKTITKALAFNKIREVLEQE